MSDERRPMNAYQIVGHEPSGLSDEEKTKRYRAGHYVMPAPPGPTMAWTEESWIKFIDTWGEWR